MKFLLPLFALMWLLLPQKAMAITEKQSGFYIDTGVGGDLSIPRVDGGLAWEASLGGWFGRYDNAFSLGRNWGVGVGVRQDFPLWEPRTAAVLEVRRSVDVIVAGWFFFAEGGPELYANTIGGVANLGMGFKGRFGFSGPYVGYRIRLRAGTRVHDIPQGTVGLTIGIEWLRPFKRPRHD